MANSQNDIVKWQAFRSGDRGAYEDIFRTYHPALLQYGSRICADRELLEDAVQDLFVEIWQSSSTSPVLSVKAYLFKALKYKLFRVMKAAAKKRGKEWQQEPVDFAFGQDHVMVGREEATLQTEKLRRSLEQLPARQREIVYLRIYQEMDYPDISDVMGINYQVARNLFHQSVKSLRLAYFDKQ